VSTLSGIKCVVFDLDGCLIRSNAFKRNAYFEVFAALPAHDRASLVSAALTDLPHGDRFQVIGRVLELAGGGAAQVDSLSVKEYATKYNDLCEAFASTCDEVPGAARALTVLASRFVLYTNSATPQEPLERVIANRGWRHLFREVLGGPRGKVDNLRHILRREGIRAEQMAFVGDEERDRAAAQTCGCMFIGLRNAESDLPRPLPFEFDNMHDVARCLMSAEAAES
jgi:phosphoglycolate phosphatase-like HAD superfamily hydrolase